MKLSSMFPVLLTLGPIIISTSSFFAALSFVFASFFLWQRLKEDYLEDDILNFTILLVLGAILGARLFYVAGNPSLYLQPLKWFSLRAEPGFSFLGAVVSLPLILFLWSKKKSWDFWLVADNLTEAFFLFLVIFGIGLILATGEKFILAFFAASVLALVLSLVFAKVYRKFIWYKSGKPGFVACLTLGIFWILAGSLEIIFQKSIYWERVGIFILALLSLGFLYRRSERSLKEDILNLRRKNEK